MERVAKEQADKIEYSGICLIAFLGLPIHGKEGESLYHPEELEPPRRGIRYIYSLSRKISIQQQLKDLKKIGVRPIRYLHQLGMLIGERDDYQILEEPAEFSSEPDICVTITEPFAQKTISPKMILPWGVEKIQAPKVWKWSRGKGIRVAVIDTGISSYHPALQRNYRGGINILSPYYEPEDYNGHGTHVAGIIAGRFTELGLIGVAPKAFIYAVKAFNRRGSANLSDLLAAIDWCVDKRMNIINMSFGMRNVSDSLRRAVQIAYRKGIIMVAATGNQGNQMQIDYPARYPETISVGSISSQEKISSFCNTDGNVDLYAPGEKIISSWLGGGIKEMSGTSMAVPHVSGTIALLLYLNRQLSVEQIRYLLVRSASKIKGTERSRIVNAYGAIKLSQQVMHW